MLINRFDYYYTLANGNECKKSESNERARINGRAFACVSIESHLVSSKFNQIY